MQLQKDIQTAMKMQKIAFSKHIYRYFETSINLRNAQACGAG